MTCKVSYALAKELLTTRRYMAPSKLGDYRISTLDEVYDPSGRVLDYSSALYINSNREDFKRKNTRCLFIYDREIARIEKIRPNNRWNFKVLDSKFYWSVGGRYSQVIRDRLSAFGVNIYKKGGNLFWARPDGLVEKINANERYEMPAYLVYMHLNKEDQLYTRREELICNSNCIPKEIRERERLH